MQPISIGKVPTGSIIIRRATIADLRDNPSRVALAQSPDGRYVWLTVYGNEQETSSSSQAQ